MKFSIKRSAFIQSLNTVSRAISSKTTIPILTGIKITADSEGLILTGSNADISIETQIKIDDAKNELVIEEEGSVVLTAGFFVSIVRKLPDEKMDLSVSNDLQTTIKSGQSEFTINGLNASNYPHLPEIDTDDSVTFSGDIFKEIIGQTVIAVSTQESRPILTGVHFELSAGKLLAVATDSHRLSQRSINFSGSDRDYNFIIPGKSLNELSRMIEEHQDLEMRIAENQVLFIFGDTFFYSRLLEGNYPDTSRLIPEESTTQVQLEAPTLLASIERASLLSHASRNNVVKLTITPSDGRIEITGDSPDVGTVEEELEPESVTGDELEISFNPDYVKDALHSFGKTMIEISFSSALRPFTLKPTEDGDSFIQLVTPVRTF
ncbi:DNA polymerase III subunit beta [Lactobacillus sp. Sy-1]|uniref:DNA polymerase III subunit beta n=1 Tax=Lactobacillus sp. Sy-1 TaxID=2109645 RepID=UPI001C57829A|nr:DNA polymerase III subunit beta [Lactobacillus sp. Sy-1]MBW1604990.1 DNA polymerase III subunit beta [Lactobacillus sp. Sy-1]